MADLPVHFMDEFEVDVCAICLSPIREETEQSDEEAFLDNCYHRFHQQVQDPLDFARIYQRNSMLVLLADTMPAASVCHVLDGRSEGSPDVGFVVHLSSLQSTLHFSATQLSRQHIQVSLN